MHHAYHNDVRHTHAQYIPVYIVPVNLVNYRTHRDVFEWIIRMYGNRNTIRDHDASYDEYS